ncbi:type III-B CRISPR-associated protein Cas10/Cmr2 [Calditrichota bacterium LG25]
MKFYKAIIEIGPIFDYVYATRKARDLWGASFLFSYLMGEVAHFLDKNGVTILRPALQNDQLYAAIKNRSGDFSLVHAGTIPDSLYCELQDPDVLKELDSHFQTILHDLLEKAKKRMSEFYGGKSIQDNIDFQDLNDKMAEEAQLNDYFRLFYVYSDTKDFDELEQASFSRGRIHEFPNTKDETNTVGNKYERCLLCGDRKQVVIIKNLRPDKNFTDEPLCAICAIKRSMFGLIKKEQAFSSTTKVASVKAKEALEAHFHSLQSEIMAFLQKQRTDSQLRKNLIEEIGVKKYRKFQEKMERGNWHPKNFSEVEEFIDFRNYFSRDDTATKLRNALKEVVKNNSGQTSDYLPWLERPFYAMVAMDADGMGSLLRNLGSLADKGNKEAADLAVDLSRCLGDFANHVHAVIEKNHGVLFYAGGEDVLFMIHPAYLIQTVQEISEDFHSRIAKANTDKIQKIMDGQRLTISAGAYICFHKHPLKLAIQGAHHQLDGVAKQQPGKNTLAIQLYKGGGERANVVLKILPESGSEHYSVEKFNQIVDNVSQGTVSIPRGFVYKLSEEYEVFSTVMKNERDVLNYVTFHYQKTRGAKKVMPSELQEMVRKSCNCSAGGMNYMPLIHRLYFIRFLTGDGA